MRVAILGCGPAGLIAAEAARSVHPLIQPTIISRKLKSVMPGAQYLHDRIPGVSPYEPSGYIRICKQGTAEGYASKVYGDPLHPVSWDKYEEGYVPAWSLKDAYDRLWSTWAGSIRDRRVTARYVRIIRSEYDLIISTIPAPTLCVNGCKFDGQRVWFTNHAWRECPENTIIYNGEAGIEWYRTSILFGHESTEYSEKPALPATEGFKPTFNDCDCAPDNLVKIGRFGSWNKNALLHTVWKETQDALQRVQ